MLINFNLEKLNALLLDFYKLTGLTISVWDADFNQLCYQPREMPDFCKLIKSTKLGKKRCLENDKYLCQQTVRTNQTQTHCCHAGLIDTAIPIKFKETLLGFLMFGQAKVNSSSEDTDRILSALCKELRLNKDVLVQAHNKLNVYSSETIHAAANILKLATRYLWLSDMIDTASHDLIEQIDTFIRANLSNNITIDDLCQKFAVSKNKLYALFQDRLHTTIGAYIKATRIDVAKKLLTTTDLLVYEICEQVGISEYNYFTTIFKKSTGVTPLEYRKKFPFILHT